MFTGIGLKKSLLKDSFKVLGLQGRIRICQGVTWRERSASLYDGGLGQRGVHGIVLGGV